MMLIYLSGKHIQFLPLEKERFYVEEEKAKHRLAPSRRLSRQHSKHREIRPCPCCRCRAPPWLSLRSVVSRRDQCRRRGHVQRADVGVVECYTRIARKITQTERETFRSPNVSASDSEMSWKTRSPRRKMIETTTSTGAMRELNAMSVTVEQWPEFDRDNDAVFDRLRIDVVRANALVCSASSWGRNACCEYVGPFVGFLLSSLSVYWYHYLFFDSFERVKGVFTLMQFE